MLCTKISDRRRVTSVDIEDTEFVDIEDTEFVPPPHLASYYSIRGLKLLVYRQAGE